MRIAGCVFLHQTNGMEGRMRQGRVVVITGAASGMASVLVGCVGGGNHVL